MIFIFKVKYFNKNYLKVTCFITKNVVKSAFLNFAKHNHNSNGSDFKICKIYVLILSNYSIITSLR